MPVLAQKYKLQFCYRCDDWATSVLSRQKDYRPEVSAPPRRFAQSQNENCCPVKPAAGGGRILFFTDPEGNLLHLVERPADSAFR